MRRLFPALLAIVLALPLPAAADGLGDALDQALEAARKPPSTDRAELLYAEKKFEEAAGAFLEYVGKRPDDAGAWYNLCCCLSLCGRKDDACRALEQAVQAGFRDADHIEGDADLDPIRRKKAYRAVVEDLKKTAGPKSRTLWVEGGALLPCSVIRPRKFSSKKEYGLVLLVHGRGDNAQNFLGAVAGERGDDFIVAALESPYLLGTLNGRQGYCWSPWQSGAGNIEKGYQLSANSVGQALKALKQAYKVDPKRVYLLGFSEGAFLTAHAAMMFAEEVAGYVCVGGGLDQRLVQDGQVEGLRGKRILVAHGVRDNVVPFRSGKTLSQALEKGGVQHDFLPYEGAHTIPEELREGISGWLRGREIPAELRAEEPE